MPSPATRLPLSDELFARTVERGTMYSFVISEAEAEELAQGRVPENVQRMAELAIQPVEQMFGRKQRKAK